MGLSRLLILVAMRNNIKKNRIMWFIQTGKKGHEQSDRVPSGHSGTVRVGSNGWDPTGAGSVSSCGHMRTVCAVRYWPEPRTVLLLKTKHQLAFYSCGADGLCDITATLSHTWSCCSCLMKCWLSRSSALPPINLCLSPVAVATATKKQRCTVTVRWTSRI